MAWHRNITKEEVEIAWEAVRLAGGGAGNDGKSIQDVKANLDNELYKIWNRLSSGSYMAQEVKLVQIPKAKGGFRTLGIPNVTDRVAQMVIKNRLEEVVEAQFHEDSYAYRPGKGAIDAIGVCRKRCFKKDWVLEIDIKGFFDAIDHQLMMEILRRYVQDRPVLLYCERFLKAKGITQEGELVHRDKGTPQGGVISPVLANLCLHEAFDKWMAQEYSHIQFERYADDIIVHCVSETQALLIKRKIQERLEHYKLELHPQKTRIVYTGTRNDLDDRGHEVPRKFTFLGYDFKLRTYQGKRRVFSPGMGSGAFKRIGKVMHEEWQLNRKIGISLEDIALEVNPYIRGWINYYGQYRRSMLWKLAFKIDLRLARFLKRKCKKMETWHQSWEQLQRIRNRNPELFCHWVMISQGRRAV